jgi:hypothetical protein
MLKMPTHDELQNFARNNPEIQEIAKMGDESALSSSEEALFSTLVDSNLADHIGDFGEEEKDEEPQNIPVEMLNYNESWRTTIEYPDPPIENFISDSRPDKYRFDQQVSAIGCDEAVSLITRCFILFAGQQEMCRKAPKKG